jgi:hypothetical protein
MSHRRCTQGEGDHPFGESGDLDREEGAGRIVAVREDFERLRRLQDSRRAEFHQPTAAIFDLQVQEDASEPDGAVLAPYPQDTTLTR